MDAAAQKNQAIYDDLWIHYDLFPHDGWSAWEEIAPFFQAASPARTLEIGPGKFPHVPIAGSHFVDLSHCALGELQARGGLCARATTPLPFPDGAFDLVCAFEVFEHVEEDERLFAEIRRVLSPGGVLFFSCPLNPDYFTYYDKIIGHVRRYRGVELRDKLLGQGFRIERACARHDRMDRWFGAMFGFGMRYMTGFTSRIVRHYLPRVAALPWPWRDGDDLSDAEARGSVIARARVIKDA
jgi:SAM-dependent methyltransferase